METESEDWSKAPKIVLQPNTPMTEDQFAEYLALFEAQDSDGEDV